MSRPLRFALNRMLAPCMPLEDFFNMAVTLNADAIEIRNDLPGVEINDGTSPERVRGLSVRYGVRVLSINALYPFDVWDDERRRQTLALAAYARDCGAEGLVMCPLNSLDDRRSEVERAKDLRTALSELAPILREHGILGFLEPLGFEECALRHKRKAVEAIKAVGGLDVFRLVHDTFHHHLAGETEFFPELTGLVHISGVEDRQLALGEIRDGHRVLVGANDLLGNAEQIEQLLAAGYRGHISFEPFAESVHALADVQPALEASMRHLEQAIGHD